MSSLTQPVSKQSRGVAAGRTVKEWLDLLSTGECDQAQFLRGVGEVLRKAPDAGWELLGLIDQYFRRGKISAQTFGVLKAHLQGLMVGTGESEPVSAPPRMQGEPASAPVAKPAVGTIALSSEAASTAAVSTLSGPAPGASTAAVPQVSAPAAASAPARRAPTSGTRRMNSRASAPVQGSVGAEPADPTPRALVVGDVLRARYIIQGLVGQGGMGTVYAATDQFRLDRSVSDQRVALKVLHTEVIKRPRLFAELRREFQHLQSLSHPNIVRVHEFDRDGDLAFFTMEFLSGALLSKVLSAQESFALHRPYALAIIRCVGSAVTHAHARGIVHGDLNPGNIFITDEGEVRVLDFGASHQLHRGPWISEFSDQEHVAVATRGFASCQVLAGETADARDDVFALACVAYVLLTGDNPFHDYTALKARTLRMTPRRPQGLNSRQWNALRAGLSFDRERRPADMRAWLDGMELHGAAPNLPPLLALCKKRPRRRTAGNRWMAPAIVLALVVGAWWAAGKPASMAAAQTVARQLYESASAQAAALQTWARGREESRRTDPVIEGPADTAPPSAGGSAPPAAAAVAPTKPGTAPPTAAPERVRAAIPAARPPAPTQAAVAGAEAPTAARARIELAADNVEVSPADPVAQIVVRRSHNLRSDVSFTWWTESGTAKPGRDFVPVTTHTEHMDSGQSFVNLVVPVVVDPERRASRSFYVVIDEPSDNAILGSHTLTMVTMPGSDPELNAAVDP